MNKFKILGFGTLLGLGLLIAKPALCENVSQTKQSYQVKKMPDRNIASYIEIASESLKKSDPTIRNEITTLLCLEQVLGKKIEKSNNPTINDIANVVEQVVDKYIDNLKFNPYLLRLADSLYGEQKKEIGKDSLKELLNSDDKYGFKFFQKSFSYHVWLCYLTTLNKTGSIEKTHKKILKFYEQEAEAEKKLPKNDSLIVKQREYHNVRVIFKTIEDKIPKGDSELIKRIKDRWNSQLKSS